VIRKVEDMTVDPDAQRAAAGDMDAFEKIYRRYHQRVYSHCLRMVRNSTDAEDLTQEVFIQLFRKIHTFRGDSSFTTWLHRLTVNQVLMHLRKPIVKTEKTTEDGATPIRTVRGTENPSRMAVIDRIALDQAIGQLPPGYRVVFILHDIEGYEHEQIGKILGCAVGTSKSQLHKARLRLRQFLAARQPNQEELNNAPAVPTRIPAIRRSRTPLCNLWINRGNNSAGRAV
jgi:RNA polymerase sigma-70 factor, ECF subfamily